MVNQNSANQLRLGEYAQVFYIWYGESPIIYQVFYIPGGSVGFLNHQQYGQAGRVIGGITIFFPTAEIRSLVCQLGQWEFKT